MSNVDLLLESSTRILAGALHDQHFDDVVWSAIEDAGFDRLLMSEDAGGVGNVAAEAAAFCRPLGIYGTAIPLIETLVANQLVEEAGLEFQPGPKALVATKQISVHPEGLVVRTPIQVQWAGLSGGMVLLVSDDAGDFVVHARGLEGAGRTIAGHPAGVLLPGMIEAPVSIGRVQSSQTPFALAALLKASALAGAMEQAVALSLDYANTRRQFGRAIGSFQAVQHMVVSMASEAAAVDVAVKHGAAIFPENPLWATALAKGRASEAAGRVAAAAHQLHGAIGYSKEFSLHRTTLNMWEWREDFGNERYWYNLIGNAAVARGGEFWPRLTKDGLMQTALSDSAKAS